MRRYIFLLTAIGLLLAQTLPTIGSGRFTFAFDMGRDLLWVRNMVELKKPTLIGPWGSIAGVYFGPLWYYLLAIPCLIFSGDPRAAVSVPLAANLLTIIIGWLFLRRRQHRIAADIFALLYSVSPMVVSLSSFAFHANLLPLSTLLFLIGLTSHKGLTFSAKRLDLKIPFAAFMASIAYHLEPAAGVMMTGFLIIWTIGIVLKSSRGRHHVGRGDPGEVADVVKRTSVYSFILFTLPFTPQLIFELRHNFIQTNSLVSYFRGENTSLGGVLPLSERITERFVKISDVLSYSLLSQPKAGPPMAENEVELLKLTFALVFLFACLTMGFLSRLSRGHNDITVNYSLLTINFIVFHYLAYTFLFPAELKSWYLYGFSSLFILSISLIIARVSQLSLRGAVGDAAIYDKTDSHAHYRSLGMTAVRNLYIEKILTRKLIAASIVAAFMFWNTNGFTKLIPKNNQTAAGETLTAQLEMVDWIYQDGLKSAEPFSVYAYTPPIYDYTYQYLIWWRGTKRYGKLPAEFSYLPGETSYLPEKEKFISADWKPQDAKIIYLIIEPETIESRRQGWLGHFASTTLVSKIDFSSGVTVEKRYK